MIIAGILDAGDADPQWLHRAQRQVLEDWWEQYGWGLSIFLPVTSVPHVAHVEQTPPENTGRLNGVQLWSALPDHDRHVTPGFVQVTEAPGPRVAGWQRSGIRGSP